MTHIGWAAWWTVGLSAQAVPPGEVHDVPAIGALVELNDDAVLALQHVGCALHDPARSAEAVLALQQIGTAPAVHALVQIADCAADEDPRVHEWAVQAAAAVTSDPLDLVVLYEQHEAFPAVLEPVHARAVSFVEAGEWSLRHWLAAPGSGLAQALAESHPDLVPVRGLCRAVAGHASPGAQVRAADVLLRLPVGHPGLGDALVEAHRFDPLAEPPSWPVGPQVARFTLPPSHARPLASALVAWLLASESQAPGALAEAAWSFVDPAEQRLGRPQGTADWLHLWAAFETLEVVEQRLPLPMLPSELQAAWEDEMLLQRGIATRDRHAIAAAATAPSPILRTRAHRALRAFRPGPQRGALRTAYRDLVAALDTNAGPRAYRSVASIVSEGGGVTRWPDIAPLGHQLIERYLWADRVDDWGALNTYEDALLGLQDAYDAGRGTGGCCVDGWLGWLATVDGRDEVRERLRHLGLMRIPHFRTLVRSRLR
ncbi:MAG: hypothetical protein KTR31_03910 [Myxococcales bacterium]|nr:hypothetical protein [Myxococcales bacterium]